MAKNTVIVSILGDTRDLDAKLGGAGSSLGKLGAAALVAGAAVATAVGVKAVKSASDLEQAMGGMNAVFKDNAGQMEQWASGAASAVGLAKSEYAQLATVLGSQMKNMGVSSSELAGQTNQLIGLGADLAAQFGGSTSDAVSALSSLLRGERDPIERYGVSINEAAVKAKMAEMGLAGLTGEAEKNAKLSATLALLYAQTADAQGAFARESTTLAGAQQRLSAGAENLYAVLGTTLLPAVTAVTAAFGEMVNRLAESSWFQALTANLTEASNSFADFIFGILNGTAELDFGAMFSGLLDAAVNGITNAATWLASGGAQVLFDGLISTRQAILDGALSAFPAILDALVQILPELVAGLAVFVQQLVAFIAESAPLLLTGAVTLFTSLIDAVLQILPGLLETIMTLLPELVASILSMLPGILDAAVTLFTTLIESLPIILPKLVATIIGLLPTIIMTILTLIPQLLNAAVQLFTALVSALPIMLPNLLTEIIGMLPQIIQSVISMLPALIEAAVQLFLGLVTAIPQIVVKLVPALLALGPQMVGAVQQMIPQLLASGGDLIQGLINGLVRAGGRVASTLLSIAKKAVSSFLSFMGIHSPSRLFSGFGKNTVQGLVQGLTRNGRLVDGAMVDLSERVADGFNARLTAPEIDAALHSTATRGSSTSATGNTYQITVQAIAPGAEVGRAVVQAIQAYEQVTATAPAGALA